MAPSIVFYNIFCHLCRGSITVATKMANCCEKWKTFTTMLARRLTNYARRVAYCRLFQSSFAQFHRRNVYGNRSVLNIGEFSSISLDGQDDCWKSSFRRFYCDFKRYIDCYAEIKLLWEKIDEILAERVPSIHASLNIPSQCTEQQLDVIEERIGQKLPDDFRCSYRICDGQKPNYNSGGLFGGYELDDTGDYLFSMTSDSGHLLADGKHFYEAEFSRNCSLFPIVGRKNLHGRLIIRPHFFQALFLAKDSNYPRNGSVVSFQYRNPSIKSCELFIYANSFKEFLEIYLKNLKDYPVQNDRLLKFTFNSVGDTGPFRVETRTSFLREHSSALATPPKYVYRYYITMKMKEDANAYDSCQLETRHWVITDADGNVERVDGPGVVGEFPVMTPGASHYWISGTSYSTTMGEMKGHFTMKNLRNGLPTLINCPTYVMKAPENLKLTL